MLKPVNTRIIVGAKIAFFITMFVMVAVTTGIFISGPKDLYNDALTTAAILSVLLFTLLTAGLYKGIGFKDDMPNLFNRLRLGDFFSLESITDRSPGLDLGDDLAGIVIGILIWFVVTIVISILLTLLMYSIWAIVLTFIMALYWVFYRAIRIVFRKGSECKGNLPESIKIGLLYSFLYTSWFYAVVFISKIFKPGQ